MLVPPRSDDLLRGPTQELDLGSDDEEEEEQLPVKLKSKKSKQADRPLKIIPTASDASSDESDEDEDDEDGPVTRKNIEARSRALDAKAAREAELDIKEMQQAALAGEESGDDFADADMDEEGEGEDGSEEFVLPTAEEREEEKKRGGPDVHTVQRRMRECVRVLGSFKRLAAKGRCVHFTSLPKASCTSRDERALGETIRVVALCISKCILRPCCFVLAVLGERMLAVLHRRAADYRAKDQPVISRTGSLSQLSAAGNSTLGILSARVHVTVLLKWHVPFVRSGGIHVPIPCLECSEQPGDAF